MRNKYFIVLAICLCFVSLISASTMLEIQTLPDHEIFITEIDAYASGDIAVTQPLHTFTGKYGKIELEYFPQKSTFKLGLLLKNDGLSVIRYKILEDNFHEDETIVIDFLPNGIDIEDVLASIEPDEEILEDVNVTETNVSNTNSSELNETVIVDELVEEESVESESNESSPGIFKSAIMQGSAVLQENKPIVNMISYGLIAIILAVPIFLFVKKRKGKMVEHISKLGDLFPGKDDKDSDNEEEFDKAESDLKKAREKIDDLKGKKISAARQKLMEDEKELMRLRSLGKD